MGDLWAANVLAETGKCLLHDVPTGLSPFPDPGLLSFSQVLFLTVVYGLVLFQASNLISDGAELLLLVPSVAPVVGSVVLPVLGAVPDGMMVMFSGMGPREGVEYQVNVGVGTLAGSTIMLLTLPWFCAVIRGRVNLGPNGMPTYKRPVSEAKNDNWSKITDDSFCVFNSFSLFKTGVGIGEEVRYNARLMLYSLGGYIIVQGPALFLDQDDPTDAQRLNLCAAVGTFVCLVGFVAYLWKMWKDSQSEESHDSYDQLAENTVKAIRNGDLSLRGAMAKFQEEIKAGGGLKPVSKQEEALLNKGNIVEVRRMCKILHPFFQYYDIDGDNSISFEEFRMILSDVRMNLTREEQLQKFEDADVDKNGSITFEEFSACIISMAMDLKNNDFCKIASNKLLNNAPTARRRSMLGIDNYIQAVDARVAKDAEEDEEDGAEEEDVPDDLADLEPEEQQRRIRWRAIAKTGAGTLLVLVFSDPSVDLLAEIGKRLNMSPFYIAFVLAPVASNASELVAAMQMASRRTMKHQQVALSVLEGAACMNNTYCLGTLLALIWIRQLPWNFTSETISIITIQLVMFFIVYSRKVQTLAGGFLVLTLYPISLLIVYYLKKAGLQ